MEKVKQLLGYFLFSELIIIIAIVFNFGFINNTTSGWFFIFILGTYIFYTIKWNLILTFIFYFINDSITKLISAVSIVVFLGITLYLFYHRSYYESLSLDKYPHSFMRDNIEEVLIFFCLIINQLLLKFYCIIWDKMKKTWKK
ncbi:hypothetical protein PQ462_04365 [Flavobacterium sp. KACC 22758]|uniref:hypothetical protein n=1 Tax=Flavobacterium sp. KACC 22758 TaxID=3025667 RepID=UPI0023664A32|nr:hypothetical protein [Flavobacterium sp. KACC 22758]WDF60608.1 hypothetical protein PQ462_04365 [Flavobacterium sp. KACC 22758]